jgi:hypothetical protein
MFLMPDHKGARVVAHVSGLVNQKVGFIDSRSRDEQRIHSGVNFPIAGCWEVAGRFKGSEVKFVVEVRP